VSVLDDDRDELAGVTRAELDALVRDHDSAAGVDAALSADGSGG
jgi:hypothetical protein